VYTGFPKGLPAEQMPPGLETKIIVKIFGGKENLILGTETMYYRFDSASAFTTVKLTPLGNDLYEAVIPNTKPGDFTEYYFSAEGDGGSTSYSPWLAPNELYSIDIYFIVESFQDDFELASGWSVRNHKVTGGEWERGDPVQTSAQPGNDHTVNGTKCFVTGRLGGGIGNNDLDGGPTILTSPTLDMSQAGGEINFYVWFYHSNFGTQEPLSVMISNDNGLNWIGMDTLLHDPAWRLKSYKVSDYVTPTGQVKISFWAEDNPDDNYVEALVDDFSFIQHNYNASLWADAYSISTASGAVVNYSLDAGVINANRQYLLMGSLSGTSPGFTLPGGHQMPLNWDAFTNVILHNMGSPFFQNFIGLLDGKGCATASFDAKGPLPHAILGLTAHFVYLLPWDFSSNPIAVTFDK